MNTDEAVNRLALLRFFERHDLISSTGFAAQASFLVGEGQDHVHQDVHLAIIREDGEVSLLFEYPLSANGETVPQHLKPTKHLMRLHRHGKLIVGHNNGAESDFIVWLTPIKEGITAHHSINHGFWVWVRLRVLRNLPKYFSTNNNSKKPLNNSQ